MIRFLAGIGILAVLLGGSLWLDRRVSEPQEQIAQLLEQAAQSEPERARDLIQAARAQWEKEKNLTSALAEHGTLEECQILFDRLTVIRDEDLSGMCLELAALCRHCAEARQLHWWNVF